MGSTANRQLAVRVCAAVALVVIAPCAAVSQPAASTGSAAPRVGVSETLGRRGDLTLRDATLESALFTISELWGVNIVAPRVDGSVNGVFKDAPLKDILDSILQSNGYAYRPVGGSLIVSLIEDLGQVNPFFVTETISVGAADVTEVVEAARLLSTPQGQVRALPSAGAILVVDFPERVERIRGLATQLDLATRRLATPGAVGVGPRQVEVSYFRTHFIAASVAAAALEVVLSSEGRVASVDGDDRLLVVDYPENVRMVQTVLARLDRPRPQVNIRSLIYDISLSDLEQIGINWDGITDGAIDQATGVATGQNSGLRFLTQTADALTSSDNGGAFTFYTFDGNVDIRAVVVALQQAEDSRLLADPNVTVMDNEAASIQSVSEIPFQQLTQTAAGGNIGTTEFKEVGIKLDVTPKIARDGTIDLTVIPEFSRLVGFTPGDNQPIVDTRRANTRVRVQNAQTIMIAGLRQRSDVGEFNGVPLLKDVRFLGHLFRSRDTQVTESELVVFLTPEIVGYSDPLSERDQLSVDTVNCRLDHIPAAEGRPNCGLEGPCNCGPIGAVDPGGGAEPPVVDGPTLAPLPVEVAPVQAPAQPVVEEVLPLRSEPVVEPLGRAAARRLPATGDLPTYDSLTQDPVANRAATPEPARPLRVDYESRFRATGGVYPNQQRVAERPRAPRSDGEDESPMRTSLGDWFGWR